MNFLILILSIFALITWLVYFPFAILIIYCLKNISRYETDTKKIKKVTTDKFIIFRIVTRGGSEKIINDGIKSIIDSCKHWDFKNYNIDVITQGSLDHFNVAGDKIFVPDNYKTKNNTKYKARALQYAIEHTNISKNTWILHLDDESKVTPQTIGSILLYLKNKPKLAAEGAINYPHEFGRNYITSFLEGERSVSCMFCISQLEIDPVWLHGSNLLVRSDVEKEVGWDFGSDSIAEDARFGFELTKRYGKKSFGWHGGTMLEQPTFTIRDTIRQRQRWFLGAFRNINFLPSTEHKIIEVYFLSTWVLGFFGSFLGILALFNYLYIPVIFKPILIFCLIVWALTYQ
ncbi:MAG: glycosyltransferase family 2 protein, partial [Candidatus Micrarchaeaceae archaeon]